MPTVTVLYFAGARDRTRTPSEQITLTEGTNVAAMLEAICGRHPELRALRQHLRVAVNQEFASDDTVVPAGAEVALIPPVSGGSSLFRLVDRPLDLEEVVKAVEGKDMGGVVTFTGVVRGETRGRRVLRLVYEAYVPMAERELASIGEQASGRWPGARIAIVHRIGTLEPGELAVVIAAAAPHREAAFEACRFAIEQLKQTVPIWKKEHFEDGEIWVGRGP